MDPDQLLDMTPLRPQRGNQRDGIGAHSTGSGDAALPPALPSFGDEDNGEPNRRAGGVDDVGADIDPLVTRATLTRREDLSYIWGTGIAVENFQMAFRRYLETFETPVAGHRRTRAGNSGAERFYLAELLRMHLQGRSTLELDFSWLKESEPVLFTQTVNHPTECLQIMSSVAEELYRDSLQHRYGLEVPDDFVLHIAPKRMPALMTLKMLGPQNIEQLLSIKGMVIRASKVIPEIRVACFQCWHCQYIERSVSGDKGRIFEPTRCSHCGKTYSFRLQHNLSLYEDKQLVKVQESPEHMADGETPVSISVVVYGSMVDAVVPGDRVIVTGIYRSVPVRLNANTRIIKSVFSTHVDAVHIELVNASRSSDGSANTQKSALTTTMPTLASSETRGSLNSTRVAMMDTRRLDTFHTLARRPDIYDILLRSFARTIWGHEDVKRGILAQLFGGTPKKFVFNRTVNDGGPDLDENTENTEETEEAGPSGVAAGAGVGAGSRGATSVGADGGGSGSFFRSELNVILCGDPGVAKSQLLTQVHAIAPRGVYTSGKGSSSVGLTAFVVQDHESGELVLEPGALVLSDQGLCCIDEFDKMNEATRSVLHEVMEQQTLSIAKAGIIAQLNARTSILAAANPKESQWNPQLNVVENLQIEPTLLSRFDLIFLLLDRHDPTEDRRLASHVLSLYMDNTEGRLNAEASKSIVDDEDAGDDTAEHASTATEGGRSHGSAPWSGGGQRRGAPSDPGSSSSPPATVPDPETGLPVLVHLQCEGEPFLVGPTEAPFMPSHLLSEYISIARETVFPRLTEASHKQLAACYVDLRRARGSTRTVSATLRQLESMIRLSEARAKMRFGPHVTVDDVLEAKRLITVALKESATDPKTGLISLDQFHAPDPTKSTVEGNMHTLEETIERRFRGKSTVPMGELRMAVNERLGAGMRAIAPAQFLELLTLMSGGDVIQSFTSTTVYLAGGRDGANDGD